MAESGRIGIPCADPTPSTTSTLCADKVAAIQREPDSGSAMGIGALSFTTLLPASSKIMINVESGDYAEMEERPCGCPFGEVGMRTHLSGIRSYEKLTTEGNALPRRSDLYALVDEVLPARFGGGPTDYQLVEEEVEAAVDAQRRRLAHASARSRRLRFWPPSSRSCVSSRATASWPTSGSRETRSGWCGASRT